MHTCKLGNMCLLTNPQNKRVITGFKEEEEEEEVRLLLLHRRKTSFMEAGGL